MAAVQYCPVCLTTFREQPGFCPNLSCGKQQPSAGWGRLLGEGDLLDRHYKIESALAVGGAGLTYLAREVDAAGEPIDPPLAIKVLYHARATGTFLTRLSTEAQILQELDHENIIQLRGFVHRAGAEPYLVTLFEQGGTLTQHLDTHGPLPVQVAADILSQILSALNVAHQRGVVHRDLKPDNVLLQEKTGRDVVPHVRVADFGIAKVSGSLTSHVTKMGTFIGTPEYAAPEQFEGTPPTPAADVFAAGALFVHMLTGKVPVTFSNRNDIEASRNDWLKVLPPALTLADLHDSDPVTGTVVLELLRNMMATRPEQRWTVQQVLKRLRGVVTGELELQPRQTLELTAGPPPPRLGDDGEPTEAFDPIPSIEEPVGGWGGMLAGLGVLGAGALIAAAILSLVILIVAAWQWGYFDGTGGTVVLTPEPVTEPQPPEPEVPEPGTPEVPEPGTPEVPEPAQPSTPLAALTVLAADAPERLALQAQLQALDLTTCGSGVVLATVWTDNQHIVQVQTHPSSAAACLSTQLVGMASPHDGVARIALAL